MTTLPGAMHIATRALLPRPAFFFSEAYRLRLGAAHLMATLQDVPSEKFMKTAAKIG